MPLAHPAVPILLAFTLLACPFPSHAQAPADLGTITERHELIPMRDGKRLLAYLYFPPGEGPWAVVFDQRYADPLGAATRRAVAKVQQRYAGCSCQGRPTPTV